jgi:hypothetical protein
MFCTDNYRQDCFGFNKKWQRSIIALPSLT